jgi:hypothetical protein
MNYVLIVLIFAAQTPNVTSMQQREFNDLQSCQRVENFLKRSGKNVMAECFPVGAATPSTTPRP